MMKKDVCLVGEMFAPDNEPDYIASSRSLGVAILAACLRKAGMSVDVIDPLLHQYSIDECLEIIRKNEYKYFGFSVLLNFEHTKNLITRLRKEGYTQHFTMGGVFATTHYSYILSQNDKLGIDSIVLGEGEETIVELFKCLDNGENWESIQGIAYIKNGIITTNPRRKRISNLDDLPFPATDDVSYCISQNMPVSIYTSRGCPGTCLYCGSNNLLNDKNNTWICRSADNVVEELKMLKQQFNVTNVAFVDDNFIGTLDFGKKRAYDICKRIIEENLDINFFLECRPDSLDEKLTKALYDAGCRAVFVGIESASDERLKEMGRATISADINQKAIDMLNTFKIEPMIGFMMFTPNTRLKDIQINIDFMEKYIKKRFVGNYKTQGIVSLLFSELIPISGTRIRNVLEKQGRVIEKNATYIPIDPNVYILKSIIKDHDLYQFMQSIEKKIRSSWIHLYLPKDICKISKLKSYEKDLVLMTLQLFRQIIDCILKCDLRDVTRYITNFKRKMIVFSNEVLKNNKHILSKEF